MSFLKPAVVAVVLATVVVLANAKDSAAPPKTEARAEKFAALPEWSGVWIAEGLTADISGFPPAGARWYHLLSPTAPWNEAGRAKMTRLFEGTGTRKAEGWGYPMMMDGAAPLQFLITPEETFIINLYRDVRHIYTDGRGHPPEEDRWATPWGDSVGHWEGDTLVIDTVSVQYPPDYFFSSPPLSETAHYVERLRKSGPDRIESEMTIVDPTVLSKPWVMKLAYVRQPGLDRIVHNAYDNDRSAVDGNTFTIVPPKE